MKSIKKLLKLKNKKTFVGIGLLLLVAVGVTYALFFTSDDFLGEYFVTKYNVVVNENIVSPTNWLPGEKISKNISATNNGDVDAVFRVKYVEEWEDSNGTDVTSSIPSGTVTINFENQEQWVYNSNDGYYYYKFILEPNQTTSSFVSGVTLNRELNGAANCEMDGDTYVCTNDFDGLAGATYKISFTKETAAYRKYQQVLNTSQSIIEKKLYTLPYGRTENNLQVGDEICVNGDTTECFNFIGYDGNNIKMLAKYNLNVGSNIQPGTEGVQNSLAIAWNVNSSTKVNNVYPSSVTFSKTTYWYDGSGLKSKYGSSYPADVYDNSYKDASGTNYSIAYYVENYKDKLETYGLTVQSARLLTYSEATDSSIGCGNGSCPTGFITNTSFWLGSAYSDNRVWFIATDSDFRDIAYFDEFAFGVRPVIVVAKSDVSGNYGSDAPKVQILNSNRTKNNLQVGDEICVNGDTTECFNFIRYDGDNVVMLSKWNLKVGNICDTSWNIIGEYTSSDTGYGLQSSDTRGYVDGASIYKGTVTFSSTKYWDNNKTPKSEYPGAYYPGPNFPMVYDPINYNGSPADGNYSIAYYVENYKNSLVQYGLSVQDARLLTYAEATDASIGCDGSDSVYRCPTDGFITNTSFWLGSAYGYNSIWRVFSSGEFRENFRGRFYIGVRPVIVISKNDI